VVKRDVSKLLYSDGYYAERHEKTLKAAERVLPLRWAVRTRRGCTPEPKHAVTSGPRTSDPLIESPVEPPRTDMRHDGSSCDIEQTGSAHPVICSRRIRYVGTNLEPGIRFGPPPASA